MRRYGSEVIRRWGLFALVLLSPAAARAREGEPRVVVRVAPEIAPAEASRLVSAMRSQLRDTAIVDVGGDPSSATCVVDVERRDPRECGGACEGVVIRFGGRARVVPRTGEIGASEAATIVRAAVVAAIDAAGATPEEPSRAEADASTPPPEAPAAEAAPASTSSSAAPRPAEAAPAAIPPRGSVQTASERARERPPAPPAAPPEPWRARFAVLYTGATYAAELPWQSGVRVEGSLALTRGVYAGAAYAFHPPREIAGDLAAVRVSRHAAAAFLGVETSGRVWIVGADAAAGLDDTVRSTSQTSAGLARTADASYAAATFALRLHGRWRPREAYGAGIDVAPAFELAPAGRSLVVERAAGGDPATLASPAVARLRLDVGGTFDLF